MVTGMKYRSAAALLLEQARGELSAGDTRQASEKGWGAAAQAVKAVAESRGWRHRTHAALFNAVDRLAEESGSDDLNSLFHVASNLHSNFYEDCLSPRMARVGLDRVEEFVALLAEVE